VPSPSSVHKFCCNLEAVCIQGFTRIISGVAVYERHDMYYIMTRADQRVHAQHHQNQYAMNIRAQANTFETASSSSLSKPSLLVALSWSASLRSLYRSPCCRRTAERTAAGETNSVKCISEDHIQQKKKPTWIGEDRSTAERPFEYSDGSKHKAWSNLNQSHLRWA
jgi:hypothetical protein